METGLDDALPITLVNNDSIIKVVSHGQNPGDPCLPPTGGGKQCLDYAATLHVATAAPGSRSFRPPSGAGTPLIAASAMTLPTAVPFPPTAVDIGYDLVLARVDSHSMDWIVQSWERVSLGVTTTSWSSAWQAEATSFTFLYALSWSLTDAGSTAERTKILEKLTQHGIDVYSAKDRGANYNSDGGNTVGRYTPLVTAAALTDDATLQAGLASWTANADFHVVGMLQPDGVGGVLWGRTTISEQEKHYWRQILPRNEGNVAQDIGDPYSQVDGGNAPGLVYQDNDVGAYAYAVLAHDLVPGAIAIWSDAEILTYVRRFLPVNTTDYTPRWTPDTCAPKPNDATGNTTDPSYTVTWGPDPGDPGDCIAGVGRFIASDVNFTGTANRTHDLGSGMYFLYSCDTADDADSDKVCDKSDRCTDISNLDQNDTDGDWYGNACDADFDQDGVVGGADFLIHRQGVIDNASGITDHDNDGDTDGADFIIFRNQFLQGVPGPSVPGAQLSAESIGSSSFAMETWEIKNVTQGDEGGGGGGGGGDPLSTGSILPNAIDERAEGDCGATTCIGDIIDDDVDFTIEWHANCGISASYRSAFSGSDGASWRWGFYIEESTDGNISYWDGGRDFLWTGRDEPDDTTWHHYAFVHATGADYTCATASESGCLYIDGTAIDPTDTHGTFRDTDVFTIGPSSQYGEEDPQCYITDVRVWSTARSAAEIQNHDACQISCADGVTACPTGLHFYWPVNEGSGTNIEDVDSNAFDLTLSDAGLWDAEAPTFTNDGSNDCYDDGS